MQHLTDLFNFFSFENDNSHNSFCMECKKNFISDIFERLMIFKDDYLMI